MDTLGTFTREFKKIDLFVTFSLLFYKLHPFENIYFTRGQKESFLWDVDPYLKGKQSDLKV